MSTDVAGLCVREREMTPLRHESLLSEFVVRFVLQMVVIGDLSHTRHTRQFPQAWHLVPLHTRCSGQKMV